tara:strand:- start:2152 stop:2628 length:477 start_codon:yes stop_codon:yes gene_type:complete
MDPVSITMLAAGAYKTLRAGLDTAKDLSDMGQSLATWGKACADFNHLEERQKNPPFWQKTFKGSDEEQAILLWSKKEELARYRSELKDYISWHYGPKKWDEVLAIEAQMRKQRKDEIYRKQAQIDAVINFAIGAVIFLISGGLLFLFFWFLGKQQGRW